MIVRVKFDGIVEKDKTKSILPDHIDIHVAPERGLITAKEIFLGWVANGVGMRGDSGVFHPLNGHGDVKIKSVTEAVEEKSNGKSRARNK